MVLEQHATEVPCIVNDVFYYQEGSAILKRRQTTGIAEMLPKDTIKKVQIGSTAAEESRKIPFHIFHKLSLSNLSAAQTYFLEKFNIISGEQPHQEELVTTTDNTAPFKQSPLLTLWPPLDIEWLVGRITTITFWLLFFWENVLPRMLELALREMAPHNLQERNPRLRWRNWRNDQDAADAA